MLEMRISAAKCKTSTFYDEFCDFFWIHAGCQVIINLCKKSSIFMIDLSFPKGTARRASLPLPLLETGVLLLLAVLPFILT